MQTETADQVFTFGGFTLDLRKGLLQRGDEPAFLRPKAQALLTHLAQNIGRVVPKSELMDTVWPGIYVTEDSLTQSIREIRKVLGDDKQDIIRTISTAGLHAGGEQQSLWPRPASSPSSRCCASAMRPAIPPRCRSSMVLPRTSSTAWRALAP